MPLRFGVHIPTCIEGMMYPVPFARPQDILPVALLAERVGFDSVWGNDHMTTQRYVQREWPEPPNFYEPLITFTWVAARTTRIRLATGIIVLPMRTMPVLAKQVATLDQLSGGRVILGVGSGHLKPEFAALGADYDRRGRVTDEYIHAIGAAWEADVAHFDGQTVAFRDVMVAPRPTQRPPIWVGGNSRAAVRRAARHADGWIPWQLAPDDFAAAVAVARRERSSDTPIELVAPLAVAADAAPASVVEEAGRWRHAGASAFQVGLGARSFAELLERIAWFARDVVPQV